MREGTEDVQLPNCMNDTPLSKDAACQTDMTSDYIVQLEEKVATLSLHENSFRNNDTKINYYTALQNMGLFLLVLSQIEGFLDTVKVKNMSNFQKLLLVFMKLRLNLDYTDSSYRFNIPLKTVSSIFKRVIICLDYSFKELIHWPSRDCLRATMPDSFKLRFGNCVSVIIDCFEIKVERPSLLKSQAQAYSNYKSSCTAKYLIGISPQGVITFISEGYGGRASDQFITEDCRILEYLLPRDIILADRGFKIAEKVGFFQATLEIPDSTRNRNQLRPWEVENTRKIASVRIHVERVIGCVRSKYRILKGPVPVRIMKENHEGKPLLDYIVRVACRFNNICNSIVDT